MEAVGLAKSEPGPPPPPLIALETGEIGDKPGLIKCIPPAKAAGIEEVDELDNIGG